MIKNHLNEFTDLQITDCFESPKRFIITPLEIMTAEITSVYIYGSSRGMGITRKTIHGGKGISRKYLNLSVVIHVALDG